MPNSRTGGGSERLEAVSEPLFNFAANRSPVDLTSFPTDTPV